MSIVAPMAPEWQVEVWLNTQAPLELSPPDSEGPVGEYLAQLLRAACCLRSFRKTEAISQCC